MILRPATACEWTSALEIVFQYLPAEARAVRIANALTLLTTGELDSHGILTAWQDNNLMGAHLIAMQAGASALAFPPQLIAGADSRIADQLTAEGLSVAKRRGAKLVQAILSEWERAYTQPLMRAGYKEFTELIYLNHPLLEVGSSTPILRYETSDRAAPALFAETLLKTYDGSLDCPELNNRRTVSEILAGHRAQGQFDPQLWWLAWYQDQPAGILLLTILPDSSAWELSYLGVVPALRRRGLGRSMVDSAVRAAYFAQTAELTIAVDSRNTPATALYTASGFCEVERRSVWIYFYERPLAAAVTQR